MSVSKIMKCKEHGYEGGKKGRVAGCEQCTKTANDERHLVSLYNPAGGSNYKKTIIGKRAADEHEAQQRLLLSGGGMATTADRQRTFRQLLEQILASKQTLSPATQQTYANTCKNHLWEKLGDRKLKDLERAGLLLESHLSGIEATAGFAARRTAESLIRLTLRVAVREGLMGRNPLDGVKWPKNHRVHGVPYAPEMSEVMAIREHILEQSRGVTGGEKEMAMAAVTTLIGSGVRMGELLGIDVDDLNDGKLKIRRQLNYLPKQGYAFAPTKTPQSVRTIPLPPFALAAISATRLRNGTTSVTLPWVRPTLPGEQEVKVDGVVVGSPVTVNLLFFNLRTLGQPMAPQSLANRLNRIGQGIMLPGTLHAHSFRHRYTTLLDDAGVPQVVIDEVTGHLVGGNITRVVYTRAMERGRAMVAPTIQAAWDEAHVGALRAGIHAV